MKTRLGALVALLAFLAVGAQARELTFALSVDQTTLPKTVLTEHATPTWQQPFLTWAEGPDAAWGSIRPTRADSVAYGLYGRASLGVVVTNPSATENALVTLNLNLKRGIWRFDVAAASATTPTRAWRAGGAFLSQSGQVTKTIFVKAGETLFVRCVETLALVETACRAAQAASIDPKLRTVLTKIGEAQGLCAKNKPERVVERMHESLSLLEPLSGSALTALRGACSEVSAATLNLRPQLRLEGGVVKVLLVNDGGRVLPEGALALGGQQKTFRNLAPGAIAMAPFSGANRREGRVLYRLGGGLATLTTQVGPPTSTLVAAAPMPITPTPRPVAPPRPTPAPRTPKLTREKPTLPMTKLTYPATRTVDQVDTYHGTTVADPYRWLEDANAADTKAWVEAENAVTFGFLKSIPARAAYQKRLTELFDFERFGLPTSKNGHYFYSRNDGLQNQAVLYVSEGLEGEPRVLLDPNTLSADGTVALSGWEPSDDGSLLAYSLSTAGSDWQEWHIRDVATGNDRPDQIRWAKFTGATWDKEGKGFFYSRFAAPEEGAALQGVNRNHKLYYHRVGTEQASDTLIYERPDQPEWNFASQVTEDGKYLIIYANRGTDRVNRLFLKDLGGNGPVQEFLTRGDALYSVLGNDGSVFYLLTDHTAPRKRIIAVDFREPELVNWKTVVPEGADTLLSASLIGNQVIATYLHDARSLVHIYDLTGKQVREVTLPGIGTASGFDGKRTDKETFFSFSSFTAPPAIYRYTIDDGVSTLFRAPKVAFEARQFETHQVFVTSKDGTRVPLFLTHKKGIALDGNNPVLLYAYGGFNVPVLPGFSVSAVAWMERGGVYAVANLRGGGEYGKEWYEAGTKLKKQNVFDDFIACGEWLIEQKYTQPAKLAIMGGSNGGLLVGACMTQRPELYGAALPAVGVLDMLRFNQFTIGWAWTSDYGSPDNPDEFKALLAYSPYHNLKPGRRYPATLVTTSDHDDRVVPAHSFKFAARLQAAQAPDGPPTLIRIETKAGHGAGKPTAKIIEEQADVYAFLTKVLGL